MSLIKQKQVENLQADLGNKANANQVLSKSANLSDLSDAQQARNNLDVLTASQINALIGGASQSVNVSDSEGKDSLTGLSVNDKVFVTNDGDGKWAMYIVTATVDGTGFNSTFVKIADKDLFDNAMTSSAVKSAYESNSNTNAFSDSEKSKLAHISVSQSVDLDAIESGLSSAMNAFTLTEESFTGMTVEGGQDNVLSLAHNIAASHVVTVFFGGLKISNVTYTAGTREVTVNVPYITESSDVIYVKYAY